MSKLTVSDLSNALSSAISGRSDEVVPYILYYRTNITQTIFKVFLFDLGGLTAAAARAKAHCKVMGYRYVSTAALISDLEAEESAHTASQGDAFGAKREPAISPTL
jgi:hypothetical protein